MPYRDNEDQREYQINWYHRKRNAWIEKHPKCTICGSARNIRPFSETVFPLPKGIWSWSNERSYPILKDCYPLCATHHRLKSLERRHEQAQVPYAGIVDDQKLRSVDNQIVVKQGQQIVITITIDVP